MSKDDVERNSEGNPGVMRVCVLRLVLTKSFISLSGSPWPFSLRPQDSQTLRKSLRAATRRLRGRPPSPSQPSSLLVPGGVGCRAALGAGRRAALRPPAACPPPGRDPEPDLNRKCVACTVRAPRSPCHPRTDLTTAPPGETTATSSDLCLPSCLRSSFADVLSASVKERGMAKKTISKIKGTLLNERHDLLTVYQIRDL